MKHNKWKDELYELSGGSDDYGDCTVYVKEAIPFISSLLKEQRQEMVEEVEKLDCIDFGEQASHPNWIGRTSVLSILKGNKIL